MDTEIIKRYNRERMGSVMELSDAIANMHRMLEEEGYRVVYKKDSDVLAAKKYEKYVSEGNKPRFRFKGQEEYKPKLSEYISPMGPR